LTERPSCRPFHLLSKTAAAAAVVIFASMKYCSDEGFLSHLSGNQSPTPSRARTHTHTNTRTQTHTHTHTQTNTHTTIFRASPSTLLPLKTNLPVIILPTRSFYGRKNFFLLFRNKGVFRRKFKGQRWLSTQLHRGHTFGLEFDYLSASVCLLVRLSIFFLRL